MAFLARVPDRNIRLVYLTILLLGIAYGLAISVVPVYLNAKGYDKYALGQLAIFFAGGIVSFAIPSGALIRKLGAKRVLVGSLVGYAVAVGLFPLADGFGGIAALRFFDGAFSVGVWVSSETILLARAPREDKAYCTSLYAISLALGYVIGPGISYGVVLLLGKAASFYAAGALSIGTAAVVLTLLDARVTGDGGGAHAHSEHAGSLSAAQVFWRIKMSCLATFSYGYFQASVVLFLPLYLMDRGVSEQETIIFPAFFAAGMLLFANVAAQQGDRRGHLATMRVLGLIGTAVIVAFLFVKPGVLVYVCGFVAGASLASVSPVSMALQGLVVPERDLSKAGGLYNAAYALGMLVGPPVSGALFSTLGGPTMLTHFALLWGAFVVLTVVFRGDDPRARRARGEAT